MKNKVIIVVAIISIVAIGCIVFLLNKNKSTYDDFVSDTIVEDFNKADDTVPDWHKDSFDESYKSQVDMQISSLNLNAYSYPDWIKELEIFYPEDALYPKVAYCAISSVVEISSFNESNNTSYFSYNNAFVRVYSVNGVDYVFVINTVEDKVSYYLLSDEVK